MLPLRELQCLLLLLLLRGRLAPSRAGLQACLHVAAAALLLVMLLLLRRSCYER
jgi:hypothetical protein